MCKACLLRQPESVVDDEALARGSKRHRQASPERRCLRPRRAAAGVAGREGAVHGTRQRLSKHSANVLRAWLLSPDHFDFPYPDAVERAVLSRDSGLDEERLSTWFTNARKRIWQPLRVAQGKPIPDFSSWHSRMEFEANRRAVRLARTRAAVLRGTGGGGGGGGGGSSALVLPRDEVTAALLADAPTLSPPEMYVRGRSDILDELRRIISDGADKSREFIVAAATELGCRPMPRLPYEQQQQQQQLAQPPQQQQRPQPQSAFL